MKMNNTNSFDKARELGYAIIHSEEYLNLRKAEAEFHDSKNAARLLDELNIAQNKYNNLLNNGMDDRKVSLLKDQIEKIQENIDHNLAIQNLYNAQKKYDNFIKNINNIIDYITGEEKKECSSNKCSSCSCCKNKL